MQIEGARAVVTGGASGVGLGLVRALAERGAKIVIADIELDRAEAAAAEVGGYACACDVSDHESVERLADFAWERMGGCDLLFNNAGVSRNGRVIKCTPEDAAWVMSVNFTGVFNGCSVFGRRFADEATQSWIVNTGSEHSLGFPHDRAGVYTASKHAVLGLSDVMRHELPAHVGISVFCPGLTVSNLWDAARNRPETLGGRKQAAQGAADFMAQGMDPLEISRKVMKAVEEERFFIFTHPHAVRFAQKRWDEIRTEFQEQAPYSEEAMRYDVETVRDQMMRERANGDG